MTTLRPKEILDEYEHDFVIRKALDQKRNRHAFDILLQHFNDRAARSINLGMFMELMFLTNRGYAYQILAGFVIIQLLERHKHPESGRVKYFPINLPKWKMIQANIDEKKISACVDTVLPETKQERMV